MSDQSVPKPTQELSNPYAFIDKAIMGVVFQWLEVSFKVMLTDGVKDLAKREELTDSIKKLIGNHPENRTRTNSETALSVLLTRVQFAHNHFFRALPSAVAADVKENRSPTRSSVGPYMYINQELLDVVTSWLDISFKVVLTEGDNDVKQRNEKTKAIVTWAESHAKDLSNSDMLLIHMAAEIQDCQNHFLYDLAEACFKDAFTSNIILN